MYTLEPAEFYSGVVIGSTSREVCSFFSLILEIQLQDA